MKARNSFRERTLATNVFVIKTLITRQSLIILTVASSTAKLTSDINHSFNVDVCQFSTTRSAVQLIGSAVS